MARLCRAAEDGKKLKRQAAKQNLFQTPVFKNSILCFAAFVSFVFFIDLYLF
jgi:hypothetical protein